MNEIPPLRSQKKRPLRATMAPMQTATEPNKFGLGPKIRDPTVKDPLASCTTVDCEQASAFSVACSSMARDGAQDSNSAALEGSTPAGASGWAAGCEGTWRLEVPRKIGAKKSGVGLPKARVKKPDLRCRRLR